MNGFKENRGMFNFCDTGTGKTVIALTVIKMFSAKTGKILIVCPNSTRAMWKEKLIKYLSFVDLNDGQKVDRDYQPTVLGY